MIRFLIRKMRDSNLGQKAHDMIVTEIRPRPLHMISSLLFTVNFTFYPELLKASLNNTNKYSLFVKCRVNERDNR
jgi:hypothetical protein